MKISCVMCVYNTKESYLKQAIDSILNQTFTDFELVIVDDGSTQSHVKSTIQSYKDGRISYCL
jgi:glycosyltransferase involved in cell wall biosynthesis